MGIGSRGSNSHIIRQASNQKQRSFSNDARIMIHESNKAEYRFAQNQHAIHSLDSSLVMKMPPSAAMNIPLGGAADPSAAGMGQGLYSGLTGAANGASNFNDVTEFEIYDR